ncbi:NEK2, partial [Symbiodinium sp. KB8]
DAVNEIRILASISHFNVIKYCDAFVERNNLYIVMEYAEHGDIFRQITKKKEANKYMREEVVWVYFLQICLGLKALHDMKPKNIFLTGKHHIRIGDLGCSKLIKSSSGLARTQIGTPYYMSPEIWDKKPYNSKSDIWALGCIVHELCALNPPFLANDMRGLAHQVRTARTPRIPRVYSKELSSVVAMMLCKPS